MPKPIRVAMIAPTFPLSLGTVNGGTQAASIYLCSALRDTGAVELDIIRPFAPLTMSGTGSVDDMRVHHLSKPRFQPRLLHLLWTVQRQVRQAVDRLAPDLVHVQGHTTIAAAQCPERTILTVHGIVERDVLYTGAKHTAWLRAQYHAFTQRRARRHIRNIIAISPYTRQIVCDEGPQRTWDIANPVADGFFKTDRSPQAGRVFSASHMTPLKNVHSLITAFARLVSRVPYAQLRLAGSQQDGVYGMKCRRLAEDLGIADNVRFLGLLSIKQVREELAAAQCFALCSFQENAPLSIAEAMAAGVPVLGSNICGIPWMVKDGHTGRLIDPGDPAAIADTLFRMIGQDDLPSMGMKAKEIANREYRASVVAERTVAVYREVLAQVK